MPASGNNQHLIGISATHKNSENDNKRVRRSWHFAFRRDTTIKNQASSNGDGTQPASKPQRPRLDLFYVFSCRPFDVD